MIKNKLEDGTESFELRLLQQSVSVSTSIVFLLILKFNGTPYVVHEIFGLENATKDTDCCVICMSEEKNTVCTVIYFSDKETDLHSLQASVCVRGLRTSPEISIEQVPHLPHPSSSNATLENKQDW